MYARPAGRGQPMARRRASRGGGGRGRAEGSRQDGRRPNDGPGITLDTKKVEESEAKGRLEEPHFGYVGELGTFEATAKSATGMRALGHVRCSLLPRPRAVALGCTKLNMWAKRLGDVDGWIFSTDWDGKAYPSKVFATPRRYTSAGA